MAEIADKECASRSVGWMSGYSVPKKAVVVVVVGRGGSVVQITGSRDPDYVAYVFVSLGNIIISRFTN